MTLRMRGDNCLAIRMSTRSDKREMSVHNGWCDPDALRPFMVWVPGRRTMALADFPTGACTSWRRPSGRVVPGRCVAGRPGLRLALLDLADVGTQLTDGDRRVTVPRRRGCDPQSFYCTTDVVRDGA